MTQKIIVLGGTYLNAMAITVSNFCTYLYGTGVIKTAFACPSPYRRHDPPQILYFFVNSVEHAVQALKMVLQQIL